MADLAPAGRVHAARLADRVGREVVVQQEPLLARALERIDELLVLAGAEGGDDQRLRLAAGEEGGAVRARQHVHLGCDRPHGLEIAAVDALAGADDVAAHHILLDPLEDGIEQHLLAGIGIGGQQLFLDLGARRLDQLVTLLLLRRRKGGAKVGLHQRLGFLDILGFVGRLEVPRLLGCLLGQLDDGLDHRLEAAVAEHHGLQHLLLGKLLGLGLHHHDGVAGAGDHEVEGAFGHLVDHRVEHELAVDDADAGSRDRAEERQARERERRGSGDHADDVGVVLHVMRQHGDDDLRLVLEALDEQRPDRPVDEARGQRLLLRRAPFALEVAARDLAGGVGPFLVVDGEGEEVDPRPGGFLGDHRRQHAGLAVLGVHRCVGLASHAARLQRQLAAGPFNFHTLCLEHLFRLVSFLVSRRSVEHRHLLSGSRPTFPYLGAT